MVSLATLEQFVEESNALEGEPFSLGNRKVVLLVAAQAVSEEPMLYLKYPHLLHKMLRGILKKGTAGEYRTVEAKVRNLPLPKPGSIDSLMGIYHSKLNEYVAQRPLELTDAARGQHDAYGRELHNMIFCIQPFEDGNRRIALLLMNAYRLHVGLPWLTIFRKDKNTYFQNVRLYENEVFRPRYHWAYGAA